MFSVLVAGRLPLPAPQQIDETHAVFPLDDATTINHVVVFMTGQQPFPPGYAATVHLNWKNSTSAEEKWLLLGCLKNDKPSAIFRIKGLTQQNQQAFSGPVATHSAAIGISIESTEVVDQQIAALSSKTTGSGTGHDADGMHTEEGNMSLALVRPGAGPPGDQGTQLNMALLLAPKIASNIFSYLSSFAPDSASQTIPLLKRWLEQFERKLKAQGVGFLARSDAE